MPTIGVVAQHTRGEWPRAWMRPFGPCGGDGAEPPLRGPWKGVWGEGKGGNTAGRRRYGVGKTRMTPKTAAVAVALKWYRMAAEQGHAGAQNNLGVMYDKGDGVTQDYVQAHIWYNLAAAQGNELGRENRDIVAKRMTPAQVAEAQRLAREWLKAH